HELPNHIRRVFRHPRRLGLGSRHPLDRTYTVERRFRRRAIRQSDTGLSFFGRKWIAADRGPARRRREMAKRASGVDRSLWARLLPTVRLFRDEGEVAERPGPLAGFLARRECRSRYVG